MVFGLCNPDRQSGKSLRKVELYHSNMKKNVAILIFPEVEVLDFAGPYEVFSITDELGSYDIFNVITVAESLAPVSARNGLTILPDHDFTTCPSSDILIIPGGFGTRELLANETVLAWIEKQSASAELVMSVCTGAFLLAKLGLLDGLNATTHHEYLGELRALAPAAKIDASVRFHDNGKFITSAGISAGIDSSLHVVARIHGTDAAKRTASSMEYVGDYTDTNSHH
jgi:transcriptional regulator GlxA family with amidase domain